MTIEHFPRPPGLPPTNGYSHASAGVGRLVSVAGQLPLDSVGRLVGSGDAFAQALQVFANLRRALEGAGATPGDVIRLGFFVVDLGDLPDVRRARDQFLGDGPPPTSSLVQISGLVIPGALIEIDALAMTST